VSAREGATGGREAGDGEAAPVGAGPARRDERSAAGGLRSAMLWPVTVRLLALACVLLALAGCTTIRPPLEQRTTQGPTADELWMYKVVLTNGREPNFDERRHWEDAIDHQIRKYLREHPEAANSLEVSTFRFFRRVSVGMTKEQVMILLGPPLARTTDAAEMEKIARRFWPGLKDHVKEAWAYPLGWSIYFADNRVVDITQYLER